MSALDELKSRNNIKLKFLLGLFTGIFIVFMFPKGESIESDVPVGSIWIHDDLIASFSFPVFKDPIVYKKELNEAAASVLPVFVKQNDITSLINDSLNAYNLFVINTLAKFSKTNSFNNPTFLSDSSFNELLSLINHGPNGKKSKLGLKEFFNFAHSTINNSYSGGILSTHSDNQHFDKIAVRTGTIDKIESVAHFLPIDKVKNNINEVVHMKSFPRGYEIALLEYIDHFIFPNMIYEPKLTQEEIHQTQANVSRYTGIINENERIIGKHDRVTKDNYLKIQSYKKAKGEKIGDEGLFLQSIGKFLHISFLLTIFVIYLYLFRKKIFYDNGKLLILVSNLLFLAFITFLTNLLNLTVPIYFFIFIPAASMLMTIIFDSRVGFYTTIIFSLVTGALRGNDYSFVAMNIFAGALSVYTVRDIKNRSQIFTSFFYIFLGYIIAIFAFGLEQFASPQNLLIEISFAASNALISPVLTYGLLIFFERIFNITTDLTLLELSNFDNPLLKELARRAPGTFNHSMTVGTMAETAAEKIGANPLLARVGAYFHDIGKTITPQNFVENQLNNQNIHENLTPEESVNLIVRHVYEGIELGKENKLPDEIIDFIPMHHGTNIISFFYDKAIKLYGVENVKPDSFRYPGPKPNSRETAITMLADSCESAVRSIDEPNITKVANVIENIIRDRIGSGQLSDSPITFGDISKIKEAFISILIGQHHKRIKYPKQEEIEQGTTGADLK